MNLFVFHVYASGKFAIMKNLLFIFLLVPMLADAGAEPLPSRLKVLKHSSWYQDQAVTWKREIDRNPDSAEAWFNYYFSLAYAKAPAETLRKVAETALEKWPDLFEAKLIAAMDLGFSDKGMTYYEEIRKLKPDDPEVLSMGIMRAIIQNDATEKKRIARKFYQDKLISPSLYNYAYNLLMSVGENAVLISEGEYTTVPMLVLQEVLSVRQDVLIVNADLLNVSSYKQSVISGISHDRTLKSLTGRELLEQLPGSSTQHSFYYSMTLQKSLLAKLDRHLNLTGLALKYVPDGQHTAEELAANFARFLTDYLVADFNNEGESAAGRVLEPNYLPGLIILKSHYDRIDQPLMADKATTLINSVSQYAGITRKVRNILSPVEEVAPNYRKTEIPVKEIDHSMKPVRKPLYASATEVTNESYYRFLSYLRNHGYDRQYEEARIDLKKFDEVALSAMKSYFRLSYSKKSDKETFNDYPVINISHEAAILYCDWLTQQYNQQEKRKFKKVRFRLPTLQEWQIAALGYPDFQSWELSKNTIQADFPVKGKRKEWENNSYSLSEYSILYPWYRHDFTYRNSITNQFGCYLANVLDSPGKCPAVTGDGFTMTSPVGSYFANGMQLYDMVGNVAEMIDEKGIAAGGSWAHTPEASAITSTSQYNGADVKVGFRVFMEVIEE